MRRWSQEQLGAVSGLSVRPVQRVERGLSAGLDTRRALASAFEPYDVDVFDKTFAVPSDEEVKAAKEKVDREYAMEPTERSLQPIDADDLAQFALIASQDRDDFFTRHARPQHFLCSALCQGAAKHYVDRTNGVKNIDVWSFFVRTEGVTDFNARRRVERDLGPSKFGVHPDDAKRGYTGRRVDLLGRSIDVAPDEGPVEAVRRYLRECKTASAWHLQKKVVMLLEPTELAGTVVWPDWSENGERCADTRGTES